MKYIDKVRMFPNTKDSIFLESFHKHSLGLFSGTKLYMVPCPVDGKGHTEIFVSMCEPVKWDKMWRLELYLKEEIGAVANALQVLSGEQCNLVSLDTLTTKSNDEHQFLAFLEQNEVNKLGSTGKQDFQKNIERSLNEVLGDNYGYVQFTPLDVLQTARHRFESRELNIHTSTIEGIVERKRLRAVSGDLSRLFPETTERREEGSSLKGRYDHRVFPQRYFTYSDSEHKYLCIFAIGDDAAIVEVHIVNAERPNVWFELSKVIKSNNANILASNSLRFVPGLQCEWKLILDVSEVKSLGKMIEELAEASTFRGFVDFRLSMPLVDNVGHQKVGSLPDNQANQLRDPFYFIDESDWKNCDLPGRNHLAQKVIDGLFWPSDVDRKLGNNFLINGYYKTGKSVLLRRIQDQIEEHEKMLAIYFVAKGTTSDTVWKELIASIAASLHRSAWEKSKYDSIKSHVASLTGEVGKWMKARIMAEEMNLSLTGLSFKTSEGSREQARIHLSEAFRSLLLVAKDFTVAVLVDEAQLMLDGGSGFEEGKTPKMWQYIMQSFPQIRWIIASSDQWEGKQMLSGFVAKFEEVQVQPLCPRELIEFLNTKFNSVSIHCPRFILKEISRISGNHPCYAQAIGSAIFGLLRDRSTEYLVVDLIVMWQGVRAAAGKLSAHFAEMQRNLEGYFDRKEVQRWIGGSLKAGEEEWFDLDYFKNAALKNKSSFSISLRTVPAFVCDDAGQKFSITPLFMCWAESRISPQELVRD